MKDYENCKIPDFTSAVKHLGMLTGVDCKISEIPFLKAQGLFSIPTVSEDMVRIGNKYGLSEKVTNDVSATFKQFIRIIRALSAKGIFSDSEFDKFFE